MIIKIAELEKLIKKLLQRKFDKREVDLITELVLFGELSGINSHGIVRLESIINEIPIDKPKLVYKTKLSTLIEGNGNPGMLVGSLAMQEVIRLANKNDFGLVGTKGTNSSSGSLSYYAEKVASQNLVTIIMAQSPESTPPYGGIQPLYGTNPIAFGFPAKRKPLIFDMATSAISFGALLRAHALGEKLPKNVAMDKEGNITTDPSKAINGATLSFDNSHKGAGLAMMVEVLAGLWPAAWFTIHNKEAGWGNLFMAFSPELLMENNKFKEKLDIMIETIRNSKTKNGQKVRIPGESSIKKRDDRLKSGEIEIDAKLIDNLRAMLS